MVFWHPHMEHVDVWVYLQIRFHCRCFLFSCSSFSSHPLSSSYLSLGWRHPGSWGHVGRTRSPSPCALQPGPRSVNRSCFIGVNNQIWDLCISIQLCWLQHYHDGKNDGSHCRLEDPEEGQTQGLDEGEKVDASLGDVSQVDQVRLVLGWHEEQLQAVHKLTRMKSGQIVCARCCRRPLLHIRSLTLK